MTVQAYRGLSHVPEAFLRILDEDKGSDFFVSRAFYENFERHGLLPGSELRGFAVGEPGSPQGITVGISPSGPVGFLRSNAIHFAHPDQMLYRAYTHPENGLRRDVIEQVAEALGRGAARTDIVKFGAFDPRDGLIEVVGELLRKHGFITQAYFLFGNWYGDVAGKSAEAYMAERPSQLRNTIRRRNKRMDKEAFGQFQLVQGGEPLAPAISDYVRVLVASWQGRHPMDKNYIMGLLHSASAKGVLRLGLYYVDGQPAAGQIWMVTAGVAHCYRLAYDARFSRLSVGTLLTYEMFRHVIDVDKVERIDFGIGDDPFKRTWVNRRREFWGIAGFNKGTLAGLRSAATDLSSTAVKRMLIRLGLWKVVRQ